MLNPCDEYLCKLSKKYFNASLCKFVVYSLQHSETFGVSHVFLLPTVAELSTLKQVRFLAHPVQSRYTEYVYCFAKMLKRNDEYVPCTLSLIHI